MIVSRLKRTFKLGFRSLLRHMLRSVLTMLGIVFGVGAVVAMLAVGEGASYESQERIKKLGSQNIIIRSIKPSEKEQSGSGHRLSIADYGLTYKDAERIQATVPSVEVTLPIRKVRSAIWHHSRKTDGYVFGTVPWYTQITGQDVDAGRFLNTVDMHDNAAVCVIGADIRKRLFPYENPFGKSIRMKNSYFRVIGVMKSVGSGAEDSEELSIATEVNSAVLIPLTTARSRFGEIIVDRSAGSFSAEKVELHQITVRVKNISEVLSVSEAMQDLLKKYHKDQDWEMIVPLQLLEEIKRNARMFSLVLGTIAAISLLVGGIGIMNIMLASVTERTREIGIRRALGAKKHDIIVQFLSETVVLSLLGGVIGLGVGIAMPLLIEFFTDMKVIFTLWSFILAFTISAMVGVIFGIYPASRAANMDPIEALRHE